MISTTPLNFRPALRVSVYMSEQDTYHYKPLYAEIVRRAHRAGLAGASVFHGIEGYGTSSTIHTTRLLALSDYLPVAVVIIDSAEKIQPFLPQLHEIVSEGLITLEEIQMIHLPGKSS